MQTQNPENKFWTLHLRLAHFFIILSICFSIYYTEFSLPFQVRVLSFPDIAQDNAPSITQEHSDIFDQVFQFPEAFKVDYMDMERNLKIFMYPHNNADCHHKPSVSEDLFFQNLNQSRFLTNDPDRAHFFLIPIPCHVSLAEDFFKSLISDYPYWNRTLGADHFFITCEHIYGTYKTAGISYLMKNAVKLMCSPTYYAEYVPHKDVSLLQGVPPYAVHGEYGSSIRDRAGLAFWRGLGNSYAGECLLDSWRHDEEIDIQIQVQGDIFTEGGGWIYRENYYKSKFCLCPGGHEIDVDIAIAIYYGCVPFPDIVEWRKFCVILKNREVYRLKGIIEEQDYQALQNNSVMVQKHFQWSEAAAVRLDAFHMVMCELWRRRHVTKYTTIS